MFQVNYKGLRRRDSYDEIVNYIKTEQPVIKYPERTASQLINSPYYTRLQGEPVLGLDKQNNSITDQRMMQEMVRLFSQGGTRAAVQVSLPRTPPRPQMHNISSDMEDDIDAEAQQADAEMSERRDSMHSAVSSMLGSVGDQQTRAISSDIGGQAGREAQFNALIQQFEKMSRQVQEGRQQMAEVMQVTSKPSDTKRQADLEEKAFREAVRRSTKDYQVMMQPRTSRASRKQKRPAEGELSGEEERLTRDPASSSTTPHAVQMQALAPTATVVQDTSVNRDHWNKTKYSKRYILEQLKTFHGINVTEAQAKAMLRGPKGVLVDMIIGKNRKSNSSVVKDPGVTKKSK